MVLNPLNPTVCVGDGLAVDASGRPQWRLAYIGRATAAGTSVTNRTDPSVLVASSVTLPITNTTPRPRDLQVKFACPYVAVTTVGNPAPFATFRSNIGPTATSGTERLALNHYFMSPNLTIGFPGVRTLEYRVVPAGATYYAVFDVIAQCAFGNPNAYNMFIDPLTIDAWWLGGS